MAPGSKSAAASLTPGMFKILQLLPQSPFQTPSFCQLSPTSAFTRCASIVKKHPTATAKQLPRALIPALQLQFRPDEKFITTAQPRALIPPKAFPVSAPALPSLPSLCMGVQERQKGGLGLLQSCSFPSLFETTNEICVGECLLHHVRSTLTWINACDGSTMGCMCACVCAGHTHAELGAAHTAADAQPRSPPLKIRSIHCPLY